MTGPIGARRARGILAGVDRLELWLHAAFTVLTVASAVRYVEGHGFDDQAPVVVTAAAALVLAYALRPARWPAAWCVGLIAIWGLLVAIAPSFSWCAVPLSFLALRVLPFRAAVVAVGLMSVAVAAAWTSMLDRLDPTVVLGPISIAGLAVLAYRALELEAHRRQLLLDELHDAQGDLADSQHAAGMLAERARLSRELHDSVAQGLSSINLLLRAAEQDWEAKPDAAQRHVTQAATTARDGLDEVRRVVRDLAPRDLADGTPTALEDSLRRTAERATAHSGIEVRLRVHGEPFAVDPAISTAVVRTARGALANVVEHSHAEQAAVTLTYQDGSITLDVRDDGRGFEPGRSSSQVLRGRGLRGIRERVEALGGTLTVESGPGEGTALATTFPLRRQEPS